MTALIALNQQNETLTAQIAALTRREKSDRAELAATSATGHTANAAARVSSGAAGAAALRSGAPSTRASGGAQPQTVNRVLSNNPAIRAGIASWVSACQTVTQGPLFKSLGLTADQIDSFNALELQFDINMGENVLTLRPEGATTQDVDQSIHTLLGDAGYQQYTAYLPTEFVRQVASSLAGNLFDTDTPLTSDQADQLTQILAQNSSAPKGVPPFPGQVNWSDALAQAQSVLSPQQMAVLTNLATVISSQPGLWGTINPITPGSTGRTSGPPASFFASVPASK